MAPRGRFPVEFRRRPLSAHRLWQQPDPWRVPTAAAAAQTLTQTAQHLREEKEAV